MMSSRGRLGRTTVRKSTENESDNGDRYVPTRNRKGERTS